MISCPSKQPPIALGVRSPGEAIGYPSQYPTGLTRCVHGSGEVGVQVPFEERVLSALSCFLLSLLLSLPTITSPRIPSSLKTRSSGVSPPPRLHLVIWAASGPALWLRDVAEYFGVGSFIGEILAKEVLLLARLVYRRRWELILLFPR
jgi:hypothetical protein